MILVTGADGFVGTALCKRLKKYKAFTGDICDKVNVDKQFKGVSTVIHLAAKMDGNPKEVYAINAIGTHNIVTAAKKHHIKKIVFTSSQYVHSSFKSTYISSKRQAEKHIQTIPNHLILRPTVLYGKGDTKGIGKLIQMIKKFHILPLIGNGILQPTYVEDLVQYLLNAVKYPVTGAFTITGPITTVKALIQHITKRLHKKLIIIPIPYVIIYLIRLYEKIVTKPIVTSSQIFHMTRKKIYSNTKAIHALHHTPISLTKGLDKTLS